MDNSFFIRSGIGIDGKEYTIKEEEWNACKVPYCSDGETFPRRMVNTVMSTVHDAWTKLSFKGNYKGRNKHVHHIGANKESFFFITRRLTPNCNAVKSFTTKRNTKRLCPNLSATIKKVQTTVLMTRIVTESQVDKLKQVLGTCFGIVHTKPVPTMKAIKESHGTLKPTVHVRDIDEVRAMTCIDNTSGIDNVLVATLAEDKIFQALLEIDGFDANKSVLCDGLCPCDGVDIECITSETGVTDLHFNVKFKMVLGSDLVVMLAFHS